MVKATYVDENGVKKGAWTEEEDNKLRAYIQRYGHWNWRLLPRFAGLERSGQSCRLRWLNYLKPGLKRGDFSLEERDLIIKLHQELGNKWSAIAAKLPGRTDNDIKNYWQCIQKRESGTSKSGQQAEISQFQQEFAGSDARNCAAPNLRSREHEKSNASSSDVFILDTSSSNQSVFSGAVDWNLTSSLGQNWCSSSDLLSGLDESFWNQPFVVDTCFYNHHYNNFCTLDEGDLLSPPLPCFDDDDDNML